MATKKSPYMPDRPLSKAYLREFRGWSTAYPPGLSEPTSLRIMENLLITRDGAAQIRPGLRAVFKNQNFTAQMVGGFEPFFTNDGEKALLFAAREGGRVVFKVAVYDDVAAAYDVFAISHPDLGFSIPQGGIELSFTDTTTFVKYLQIDNKILALSDAGEDLRMFAVGETKEARKITAVTVLEDWATAPSLAWVRHPDAAWINDADKLDSYATAETPTTNTLISSSAAANTYSYAFFYTFYNEVGETEGSPLTVVKTARGWSQWRFLAPDSSGNPTTTSVTDPTMAMDQLVACLNQNAYNDARDEGALGWHLYLATWSDQDSVPPEGIRVGSREFTGDETRDRQIQNTAALGAGSSTAIIPTEDNRVNYSIPSTAQQGLVAADRMVLVNESANAARITWTSAQPGSYTDFSPVLGGGQKTLTSGNLNIPVCAKLWQNPQSVDTITILCSGVDGYSTAYYMAPAEISGLSQSTAVMSFEETTATPGTVSPYGVEVLNNALYHPLDTELMKSTASNYNISHTTMTLDIANVWLELENKDNIVSSQHDNRLYYIVYNPDGEALEAGCNGNEVWVYDAAKDTGRWNRWLVQGISLRKLQIGDKLYMAIARPEGIFVFDDLKVHDDYVQNGNVLQRPIPWKLKTNTLGANRAHDAWARVQQMELTLGNWRGNMKYGIEAWDVNGKPIDINKIYRGETGYDQDATPKPCPFDIVDYLLIRRDIKEWFFYAESLPGELSYGQINYAQFRFTPVTVNVGYEYGSVETFEYGRSSAGAPSLTDNGTPVPFIDTRRP